MTATKTAVRPARVPLHPVRISPPPLRTADGHSHEPRRASWVELFFALYGGVSVCLLASAALPSCTMIRSARVARLATSAAAMGLVFMGAIVIPVYLVRP